MDMPQPTPGQPAMPGAEMAEAPETGTEICLTVAPDGSLSVSVERQGDEMGEQAARPAADIGAALKMVLDEYKKLATGPQDQQAQFDQGFQSAGQGGQSRMGA